MLGNKLINTNAGGGCTNTVDNYNPFPDGGGLALYQLNGDATDVSGNYDGTATNVTYGAGEFGQAGVFNGSSSEINLNSAVLPSSVFSVSMWFNLNTINRTNYLITQYILAGGSNGRFEFAVESTNDFVIYLEGGALTFTTSASLSANIWYNVVLIKNGASGWACYLDAQSLGTNSDTRNIYTGDNTRLGKRVGLSSGVLDGSLDQVRIFNRALRPYEVEALYTEEYCTPTIVPSEHFNTVLYTGTGTTNPRTDVGFQPDLTWIKGRSTADNHFLNDSVRGAGYSLYSNLTSQETLPSADPAISSFDSNGFTLSSSAGVNRSGSTYVAWNFKAGGAAVTNTDGTITSQVSANTEAGFSVVTFTGNGSTASVGHGLGQKPSIIFTKNRSVSEGWFTQQYMYVPSGNAAYGYLNTTAAFTGFTDSLTNNTVMQQGGTNGQNYVSYCFAEVEGFSSFGSYVGTGTSKAIVTGFEPAFVMFKVTSEADHWLMFDNKRGVVTDSTGTYLIANLSQAEGSVLPSNIRFLENGFEITGSGTYWNKANASYIYMAFAADPTAVEPTLEDSFNTVLYSGNGGTQSITGVGFQPDFLWIKSRTSTLNHIVFDSVRGAGKVLYPNLTYVADDSGDYWLSSFDNNGFTVNVVGGGGTNQSGVNYVAWNWKGAEIPTINSNGSITSVVSANPAAGFSIVSYTGNGVVSTVGHGLSEAPKVIIAKNRNDGAEVWPVYHSDLGKDKVLVLNNTDAAVTLSNFWGTNGVNDTVFGITSSAFESINQNGSGFIAYCFAEVAGFSKFGSYTGTGGAGNTVTLGFEPAFLLIKRTDVAGNGWLIADNKRDTTNPIELFLSPNTSQAEFPITNGIDFNANDFTLDSTNGSLNASGGTYIYMAFANQF